MNRSYRSPTAVLQNQGSCPAKFRSVPRWGSRLLEGWVAKEASVADITIGTTVRPAEVGGYDELVIMTERSCLVAPSTAGSDRGRLSRHEVADRKD